MLESGLSGIPEKKEGFTPTFTTDQVANMLKSADLHFSPQEFLDLLNNDKLFIYGALLSESIKKEITESGGLFVDVTVTINEMQFSQNNIASENQILCFSLKDYPKILKALKADKHTLLKLNLHSESLFTGEQSATRSGFHTVSYSFIQFSSLD